MATHDDLDAIVRGFDGSRALASKASIGLVREVLGPTDWLSGPGDDAAALPAPRTAHLLAAGEAIHPPFVAADPMGAGRAAVVANVNDVAAMGGRPLAIVDTIVAPAAIAEAVLRGLRETADRYGVPVVGGHLTIGDHVPSVSAFVLGSADALLASRNAAPGLDLLLAAATDGAMHPRFPYFSALETRADRLATDLALLPRAAEAGWCVAAKDVSMAGILGSLAMLLEPSRTGVTVDLDALPRPRAVALADWLPVFPSFAFWLVARPDDVRACAAAFRAEGIACERVGALDASGELRVRLEGEERALLDLARRPVTGLGGPAAG